MNYKVNFTFYGIDGKTLINKADVDVLDVANEAGSTRKIVEAMRRKFDLKDHEGTIRINECTFIPTKDDILASDPGVKLYVKQKKAKPFFENNDHLSFGNYTTTDLLNSKEFNKTLDSIR